MQLPAATAVPQFHQAAARHLQFPAMFLAVKKSLQTAAAGLHRLPPAALAPMALRQR
jgi:hypothetical protein